MIDKTKKAIPKEQIPEIAIVAKGAGITLFGIVCYGILNYLFNIYIARVLEPENYGYYMLGFAVFSIVSAVSLIGLGTGLIRYVALYHGVKDQQRIKGAILSSLKIVMIMGVLVALFLFFSSNGIAVKLFHKAQMELVLKFFSPCIFFFSISSVFLFSIQGLRQMKYIVYARNLFEPISRFLIITLFFLIGLRLSGALLAFLITVVLYALFSYILLKRIFPITKSSIIPIFETKKLLMFSVPLFFVEILQIGINRIDALMLGYFKQAHDVGIYIAAFQTSILGSVILRSINTIFAPIISDLYNREERQKLEDLFKIVTKWIFTISLPIFLLIIFFAKEILGIFGSKFMVGVICLIILSIGQLINSMTGSVGYMLVMIGRSGIAFLNSLGVFTLQIFLCIILIPKYGILGAAVATGTSWVIINLARLIEVYVILKIHPFKIDFLKPITAGGISFAFLYGIEKFIIKIGNPLLLLTSGAMIFLMMYAVIIWLLGLEDEERAILQKIKAKINI